MHQGSDGPIDVGIFGKAICGQIEAAGLCAEEKQKPKNKTKNNKEEIKKQVRMLKTAENSLDHVITFRSMVDDEPVAIENAQSLLATTGKVCVASFELNEKAISIYFFKTFM